MKVKKTLGALLIALCCSFMTAFAVSCTQELPVDETNGDSESVSNIESDTGSDVSVKYNVTFSGETDTVVSVKEGETVDKPDDPSASGKVFIGWYADEAHTVKYDFDSAVNSDITVYAYFIDAVENEFDVRFNVAGEIVSTVKTVGGRVLEFPSSPENGWWTSDFEDADRLTAPYDGGVITQNTTFYAVGETTAPVVWVTDDSVNWKQKGANASYSLEIVTPDNRKLIYNVSGSSYNYNFAQAAKGTYAVSLIYNGRKTTVYKNNKVLDRVSLFDVNDGVITYNAVDGAENYYVTVKCGDESHNHISVDNGTDLTFDISDCFMDESGISVSVTAKADGMADSVSDTFVYLRKLGIINVTVDEASVSWNALDGTEVYVVEINGDVYEVTDTAFSTDAYTGDLDIKVTAKAKGYCPSYATAAYTKAALATPSNVDYVDGKIVWDEVAGATGYTVRIISSDGSSADHDTTLNEYAFSGEGSVSVAAVGSKNSSFSKAISISATPGAITFGPDGTVSWSAVSGAKGYTVKVNDGEEFSADGTSAQVALNKSGENTVTVYYIDNNGAKKEYGTEKKTAYKVTYKTAGGNSIEAGYFYAGQIFTRPVAERTGYDFLGWYVSLSANSALCDDAFFGETADVTLYAKWANKSYTVDLDVSGIGYVSDEQVKVRYSEDFVLPVPQNDDGLKVFSGWYTAINAQGVRYTDENGVSIATYQNISDVTLYAGWLDIFVFHEVNMGTSYSVQASDIAKNVKTITVPSMYDGKYVSTIESNAFANFKNLETVNIPDTVSLVEVGTAFVNCSSLFDVNVYGTTDKNKGKYYSVDGVLFLDNGLNGGKELKYYPLGRRGAYHVPEGTEILPVAIFKSNNNLTEIYIPSSLKRIDDNAFTRCLSLRKVVFETPADDEMVPLTIGKKAFDHCTYLSDVVLPTRLSDLDPEIFTACVDLANVSVQGSVKGEYSSRDNVVYCDDGATLAFAPIGLVGDFEIPVGVTKIARRAMYICRNVTKLVIPASVTTIEYGAFEACYSVRSVEFKGEAKDDPLTIGDRAFYDCDCLSEVTLPANLVKMGTNAFGQGEIGWFILNAPKIKKVTLECGSSLNFANNAFANDKGESFVEEVYFGKNVGVLSISGVFGDTSLKSVIVDPENVNYAVEDGVIYNKAKTEINYFPSTRTGAYVLPDTITSLAANVFKNKTNLTSITIHKNVTNIGASAFSGCTNLKDVIFESDREEDLVIEANAFEKSGVTSLVIPEKTVEIKESAFADCTSLTSVSLPASLDRMGTYNASGVLTSIKVFNGCTKLSALTISDGNEHFASIDSVIYAKADGAANEVIMAMDGVTGEVTIPGSIVKIWDDAFNGKTKITKIAFEDSDKEIAIGKNAFKGCTGLKDIVFAPRITTIVESMFEECTGLITLNIPKTVTTIKGRAFYKCSGLTTLTFDNDRTENLVIDDATLTSSGFGPFATNTYYGAFQGCNKLGDVVLPDKTTKIGSYAFAYVATTTSSSGGGIGGIGGIGGGTVKPGIGGGIGGGISIGGGIGGGISIGGGGGSSSSTDYGIKSITIPATVSVIGDGAFKGADGRSTFVSGSAATSVKSNLATVTLLKNEDGTCALTSIGANAFQFTKITSFTVPKSVEVIGTYAFADTLSMTDFSFEEGNEIEAIATYTFWNSGLTAITIPATVKTVGNSAFQCAKALASVTFATNDGVSSLTSIGKDVFANKTSGSGTNATVYPGAVITSFVFPDSDTDYSVGAAIFSGVSTLKEVTVSNSVKDISNIFNGCYSIELLSIPADNELYTSKMNESDTNTFIYNKSETGITSIKMAYGLLTGVVRIPDGITDIGARAFEGQSGVTKFIIPSSVHTIGDYAFLNCTGATEIAFGEDSRLVNLGAYAFQNCSAVTSMYIPSGVKAFKNYTFAGCSSMESISMSEDLTEFGNYTFQGSGLKSVTIPAGVMKIGTSYNYADTGYVFADCVDLETVNFAGNRIQLIGGSAFAGCTSLKTITFPETVDYIGGSIFRNSGIETVEFPHNVVFAQENKSNSGFFVFDGCSSLKSVTFNGKVPNFDTNFFNNCSNLTTLTFKRDDGTVLVNVLPDEVVSVGSQALANTGLESIVLTNVSTFEQGALYNSKKLKTATLSYKYTSPQVGGSYGLFQGCTALEHVNYIDEGDVIIEDSIPENLSGLAKFMFRDCASIKHIKLNDKITVIGESVFEGCASLEEIVIPAHVATIGKNAFKGNTNLKSLTIGQHVTSIDATSFAECASLETIIIDQRNVNYMADEYGIIYSGDGSSIVFVPARIGGRVVLPDTLHTIVANSFAGNTAITEIVISSGVEAIGEKAFDGWTENQTICFTLSEAEVEETYGTTWKTGCNANVVYGYNA